MVWNYDGIKTKKFKLQAKNTCKFPFIYKNIRYDSCTKKKKNFWCATTVDAENKRTSWGYCNDLCPTDESWNIKIVVGISVGVLIIVALFIPLIFIIDKNQEEFALLYGSYVIKLPVMIITVHFEPLLAVL